MYQSIINTLGSSDYYIIKKDIYKLINDADFIKEIIKVHNPIVFDRFVKTLFLILEFSLCEEKEDPNLLKCLLLPKSHELLLKISFFKLLSY